MDREVLRQQWLKEALGAAFELMPLAGDASFRRYFRVLLGDTSLVLMDAPPGKEDVAPFLKVREWMRSLGLRVPELYTANVQHGWLLLEDFGDRTWAEACAAGDEMPPLFADALRQLLLLQQGVNAPELPAFDVERMLQECDLFFDWYLPYVAGHVPTRHERLRFHEQVRPWLESLAALPRVPVHLDFHSRNLMVPEDGLPLGVIDFQDAVMGPVTYDLASLLYDCYQDYAESERQAWSLAFFEDLPADIRRVYGSFDTWHRAVRLTAWQRHIKAIGIFSRLAYRDGKRQFLSELPLTRKHLLEGMEFLGMEAEGMALLHMPPAHLGQVVPST